MDIIPVPIDQTLALPENGGNYITEDPLSCDQVNCQINQLWTVPTAESRTLTADFQISGPIPSPSIYGIMGSSGTIKFLLSSRYILLPNFGTLICCIILSISSISNYDVLHYSSHLHIYNTNN